MQTIIGPFCLACILVKIQLWLRVGKVGQHVVAKSILGGNIPTDYTNDESVPQYFESLSLRGELVGCRYEQFERKMNHGITIAENLLVYNGKKRVLDSGTGFPDFIKKYHICGRQVAVNGSFVLVVFL